MGLLVIFLPFLQALSAIATIWGVAHTLPAADTVIQYGAGADGPTPTEWINSFGSLAIGLIGWLSTKYFTNRSSSELIAAVTAWSSSRKDEATIRRVAFAFADWIEDNIVTPETTSWWTPTLTALRTQFAQPIKSGPVLVTTEAAAVPTP